LGALATEPTVIPTSPKDGDIEVPINTVISFQVDSGYMVGEVDNLRIKTMTIETNDQVLDTFTDLYSYFCSDVWGTPFVCFFDITPSESLPFDQTITVSIEAEVIAPNFGNPTSTHTYSFVTERKWEQAVFTDYNEEYLQDEQQNSHIIVYDDTADLAITDEYSIEMWVKPDMPLYSGIIPIISYQSADLEAVEPMTFFLGLSSGLTPFQPNRSYPFVSIPTSDDPVNEIRSDEPIADDGTTWTHLAMTKSGNVMTLFVNGQAKGSRVISGEIFNYERAILDFFGGNLTSESALTLYFGAIDDVRISNVARNVSINWIQGVYLHPLAVDEQTLALWKFDTIAYDEGPNRLNGRIKGNVTYVDGVDFLDNTSLSDPCKGQEDINCDGYINKDDVKSVLGVWLRGNGTVKYNYREDVNRDFIVNGVDYTYVRKSSK